MATDQKLERTNEWKKAGTKRTNAEKFNRPPTVKEISAQKWRARDASSVKDNTVSPEGTNVDVTVLSLHLLETWNEYCAVMEQLNGEVYKSLFKNSVEAGKRMRQALKKQKKLIAIMIRSSLLFEQHLIRKRKLEKKRQLKKLESQAASKALPKFVLVEQDGADNTRQQDEASGLTNGT